MRNDAKRKGALRAVLEDIAAEMEKVCKKNFVVEEEEDAGSRLPAGLGPYYVLYDGRMADGTGQRRPVLAVSQTLFRDMKNNACFMSVRFFMPPDPFIIEYLEEYAKEFGIGSVRYNRLQGARLKSASLFSLYSASPQ